MKQIGVLFIIGVLASCNITKFDAYPGTPQQTFPEAMQGNYQLIIPSGFGMFNKTKPGDTLVIKIGRDFTSDFIDNTLTKKLDSTYVLSLVNNNRYVISVKDNTYPAYWNCYVLALQKNSLRIYPVTDLVDQKAQKKYFKANFIGLKNETDSLFAYTQKDSAFIRYVEKEIKPAGGIKFTKIIPNKPSTKK